jgi:putative tryptophan/tyrosine transport system substrate-binding protein
VTVRRRDVLAFLGSAAIAFPLGMRAQSAAMPVVGFLNSTSPDIYAFNAAAFREGLREATAQALGRKVIVVSARGASEFNAAFEMIEQKRIAAVLVASDPMFLGQRSNLVALAASHKIPVMYWAREFAIAGGLISYGTSITWMYREAGIYVGRILKGAKPANLPILQPTKFDFVVNLKTAKALGLTIPQSLLLRADEVIQ